MPFNPLRDIFSSLGPQGAHRVSQIDWESVGVHRVYIMVITGRVGSTALMHLLEKTGLVGTPQEFFNESTLDKFITRLSAQDVRDYLVRLAEKHSVNGTFGFKINPIRFFWLNELVDIPRVFPPGMTSWIDIRRHNVIAQGISFAKAKKTGHWHVYNGQKFDDDPYRSLKDSEKFASIWNEILLIISQERNIDQYYKQSGIRPLRLSYESLVSNMPLTVHKVLYQINGVPPDFAMEEIAGPRTMKISTSQDALDECRFYSRFPELLSFVDSHRNRLDPEKLKARVKRRLDQLRSKE